MGKATVHFDGHVRDIKLTFDAGQDEKGVRLALNATRDGKGFFRADLLMDVNTWSQFKGLMGAIGRLITSHSDDLERLIQGEAAL
jgi:hypothetical protein